MENQDGNVNTAATSNKRLASIKPNSGLGGKMQFKPTVPSSRRPQPQQQILSEDKHASKDIKSTRPPPQRRKNQQQAIQQQTGIFSHGLGGGGGSSSVKSSSTSGSIGTLSYAPLDASSKSNASETLFKSAALVGLTSTKKHQQSVDSSAMPMDIDSIEDEMIASDPAMMPQSIINSAEDRMEECNFMEAAPFLTYISESISTDSDEASRPFILQLPPIFPDFILSDDQEATESGIVGELILLESGKALLEISCGNDGPKFAFDIELGSRLHFHQTLGLYKDCPTGNEDTGVQVPSYVDLGSVDPLRLVCMPNLDSLICSDQTNND